MASKQRARYWWPIILAAVIVLCGLVIYRGAANLSKLRAELEQAQQANQRLDSDNRALYRQVQRLRQDKAALERAARREMGLVGDDEIIYTTPGKTPPEGGAQK
ncbi:MAG: septum formation initiator family protein [Desulfarculaceae bacterium]|nr:septum formation initiator family protein [Desulfarculaceae bacterium]MCF8071732.1 septum formation initiator family protein [Desulfarculaceae bacterium]MCF8102421.1 septum formation initiator family protein [Desulfarculaceae bacterium]MCF8116763.1 septum formation initiator family protein [Desulfarculaceae bacterium]